MDKYEYKVRTDEMKQLIREAKFAEAMEIADSIDWRRVKNTKMLCIVSDIYKINHKFEESKEILLMAYEKNPTSRLIVYSLCELCIKMDEVVEANQYLREFTNLAPRDNGRYILRYKMLEAQDVSLEERISVLEEYKNREPLSEKWAYELAYLYHRVGLVTRCIEECNQLFLWFREGKYVLKALELKQLHTPLTAEQQEVYDQQFYHTHRTHIPKTAYDNYEDEAAEEVAMEDKIEVKTMDVGEYNTMNLQMALAESMKEVLPPEESETASYDETGVIIFEEEKEPVAEVEEKPVSYDETGVIIFEEENLEEAPAEDKAASFDETTQMIFEDLPEVKEYVKDVIASEDKAKSTVEAKIPVKEGLGDTRVYKPITDEMIMQATKENFKPKMQELQQNMTAKLPTEMASMLSQEYDGQIRLVVPETEQVEKQITGQLNIIDVMAEWEKIKKAGEEKRAEEVRQHVLEQTGVIFLEFDEASKKKDILEGVELVEDEPVEEDSDISVGIEDSDEADWEETEEIQFEVSEEEADEIADAEVSEEAEDEEVFEDGEELSEEEISDDEELEDEEESEDEAIIDETFEEEASVEEPEEDNEEASEEVYEDEEPEDEEVFEDDEELSEDEEISDDESEDEEDAKSKDPSDRSLTPEEKMLFHSYIQTKKDKRKLITALDDMSLAAYTGNVIITGEEVADTTALAKAMLKNMQICDSNFSGKIAKITGKGLENKDVKEILSKLENGALIIESADDMSKEAVQKLYKELEREDRGIIVLMEGPKKAMNKFLEEHNILNKVFTARFDIACLSNKALVEYAKRYAKEREYSLDELAELALHSRIDDMQTNDHSVTLDEVKQIVDEAIEKANKKNLKHFFEVLCSSRYDEDDMIILRERDFE